MGAGTVGDGRARGLHALVLRPDGADDPSGAQAGRPTGAAFGGLLAAARQEHPSPKWQLREAGWRAMAAGQRPPAVVADRLLLGSMYQTRPPLLGPAWACTLAELAEVSARPARSHAYRMACRYAVVQDQEVGALADAVHAAGPSLYDGEAGVVDTSWARQSVLYAGALRRTFETLRQDLDGAADAQGARRMLGRLHTLQQQEPHMRRRVRRAAGRTWTWQGHSFEAVLVAIAIQCHRRAPHAWARLVRRHPELAVTMVRLWALARARPDWWTPGHAARLLQHPDRRVRCGVLEVLGAPAGGTLTGASTGRRGAGPVPY